MLNDQEVEAVKDQLFHALLAGEATSFIQILAQGAGRHVASMPRMDRPVEQHAVYLTLAALDGLDH